MKLEPPVRIMAVAALLALALTGLVVREGAARAGGQEVVLAITGYDPRELLTGHYVRFQIAHEAPAGTACPPGANLLTPRGKPSWVALRRQGARHAPAGAAERRADAARLGDVTVRGRISCFPPAEPPREPGGPSTPPELTRTTLDLGIERLHVDQAQAEAIARDLQKGAEAYAVFSVAADGTPRLKALVVAGKRADLDWF